MAGGLWSSQAILAMEELTDSQQQDLTAFLKLVGCRVQGERPGPQDEVSNQKLFATAYFLVSALAGMETKTKKNRATSAMAGKWDTEAMMTKDLPPRYTGTTAAQSLVGGRNQPIPDWI